MTIRPRLTGAPRLLAGLISLAVAGGFAIAQEPAATNPADKLSTVLRDLAGTAVESPDAGAAPSPQAALGRLPPAVEDATTTGRLRLDAAGRVQVYVLMDVTDDRVRALAAAGAVVEIVSGAERRVQARIAAARLRDVAALPFVDFVRPPSYAQRHVAGAVVTEGDRIQDSDLARLQFGIDGSGLTVGVISDGINGLYAADCVTCGPRAGSPMTTGDLPASTGVRRNGRLVQTTGALSAESFTSPADLEALRPPRSFCAFEGAGAEGGALLEIVHDLVPGAALRFANAETSVGFNQAVNALAAVSDVVVDDLGFFGEPANGQSSVSSNTAAALNAPANRIRAYVTSVGNAADKHYLGTFVDSGVDGRRGRFMPNRGALHQFAATEDTVDVLDLGPQPYNLVSLPEDGGLVIILHWDDPPGASANNYDLFLVRHSNGQVVARSMDVQRGRQDPVEFLDFVNRGGDDFFRIVIQNVDNRAAPKALNLFAFAPQCARQGPRRIAAGRVERLNFTTPSRSLSAQSDAGGTPASVISVGAICSASALAASVFAGSDAPNLSCLDQTHRTIQFFSSRGPTLDGRMKPDIASIDGVSVTGAGRFPSPFFGTSAAAPHVAGIAALALSAAPCLRDGADGALPADTARVTLRHLILAGADRLDGRPPDNTFGVGRANARSTVALASGVCQ